MLINIFIILATIIGIASSVKYWSVKDWIFVGWIIVAIYGIALCFVTFFHR